MPEFLNKILSLFKKETADTELDMEKLQEKIIAYVKERFNVDPIEVSVNSKTATEPESRRVDFAMQYGKLKITMTGPTQSFAYAMMYCTMWYDFDTEKAYPTWQQLRGYDSNKPFLRKVSLRPTIDSLYFEHIEFNINNTTAMMTLQRMCDEITAPKFDAMVKSWYEAENK